MNTEKLVTLIAAEYATTPEKIMGTSRVENVANARAMMQYVLRDHGWTFQRIATTFRCDHASVIHNVRKVAAGMEYARVFNLTKS